MDQPRENPRAHPIQPPPFTIRLLDCKQDSPLQQNGVDSSVFSLNEAQIQWLLPASYRTGPNQDDVAAASHDVNACIQRELNLSRLHNVFTKLWLAGRPMPPRPLHYQLLLSREIFITERMDMHMVWTTGRIFLKPIPRFLLEPQFWTLYLASPRPCRCFDDSLNPNSVKACDGGLRACALGFLFSYAALIAHESDFEIGKEKHLIPNEVTWLAWVTLVGQLDTKDIYPKIDERFKYGELRLSRLNHIYRLSQSLRFRPYMSHWNQYGSFLQDNFAWLGSVTVYIAIVLTAMQVGLATEALIHDEAFQAASYGFSVFAILGPLVVTALIGLVVVVIFISNWMTTITYKHQRSSHIQLWEPGARRLSANPRAHSEPQPSNGAENGSNG